MTAESSKWRYGFDLEFVFAIERDGVDVPARPLAAASLRRQSFIKLLNETDFHTQLDRADAINGRMESTHELFQIILGVFSGASGFLPATGVIGEGVKGIMDLLFKTLKDVTCSQVAALRLVSRYQQCNRKSVEILHLGRALLQGLPARVAIIQRAGRCESSQYPGDRQQAP